MPPQITMWTYLWDLVDDGIDDVLKEMKNDLGLTALSVATHYHTVEHYRPHTKGAFIYRDDSALYFPPDSSRYTQTKLVHRVSSLAERGNPLKTLSDRAAHHGLDLISWTLGCHSSYLGRQHPDCTMQNALGSNYPEALCPANPDVREFLKALAADLTHNYRIAVAELESWEYEPARHFHHHEKLAVPLGEAEHFLLGLCFCTHCKSRGGAAPAAGIDVDRLQARIGSEIESFMSSGRPQSRKLAELVAETPDLTAFVKVRVGVVTSLIREVVAASASTVSPIVWATPEACGADVAELSRLTGSLTICAYTPDPEAARGAIRAAAAKAGGAHKLRVGYHTFPPVTPDRESFLRVIAASLDEGVRAFSFYNYGIAPRPNLAWVRDAAALIHQRTG